MSECRGTSNRNLDLGYRTSWCISMITVWFSVYEIIIYLICWCLCICSGFEINPLVLCIHLLRSCSCSFPHTNTIISDNLGCKPPREIVWPFVQVGANPLDTTIHIHTVPSISIGQWSEICYYCDVFNKFGFQIKRWIWDKSTEGQILFLRTSMHHCFTIEEQ